MNLKDFDPKKVGQAEIGWWKAHNEHNKSKLLKLLIKQHVYLYQLKPQQAKKILYPLFEATKYHDNRNWDKAIEKVSEYYQSIQKITKLKFDPPKAAKLEVGW